MLPHPKAQCSATRIRRSQVPSRHASRARLRVGPIATPLLSVSATCHTETPFHHPQTQALCYRPVNCRPLPAMMTLLKRRALLRASGPPAHPLRPRHSIEAARKHRIHSPRSQRRRRLRRAPLLLSRPRAPKRDISIHSRDPRLPFQNPQNFVTPARKPSYMAIHDRFRQLQGQEAPIPEDASANYTPAVPSSPYPFPMASAVKNSHFTGGRKAVLNRRDLERARSATPGGGSVGSDSRQSGGSNAVREISEREAWDEMMAAVQKSVRKKQPAAVVPPTPQTSSAVKPAGLPRSSTDPQLSASKPVSTQPSRRVQPHPPADNAGSRGSLLAMLCSLSRLRVRRYTLQDQDSATVALRMRNTELSYSRKATRVRVATEPGSMRRALHSRWSLPSHPSRCQRRSCRTTRPARAG